MSKKSKPGRWCPNCGAAYAARFRECSSCRVLLVDKQLPPELLAADVVIDLTYLEHAELAYDLSEWTEEQHTTIEQVLESADIEFVWEGEVLSVAPQHQETVDDIVDMIEEDDALERQPGRR
jgi:hypothetical protein